MAQQLCHLLIAAPASGTYDSAVAASGFTLGQGCDVGREPWGALQITYSGLDHADAVVSVYCSCDGKNWDTKSDSNGNPVAVTLSATGAQGATKIVSFNGVMTEQFYKVKQAPGSVTTGVVDAFLFSKKEAMP